MNFKRERKKERRNAEEIMRACRKARQQTDEDESIVMRLDQHLHHYLTIFILKCGVSAVMPPHET